MDTKESIGAKKLPISAMILSFAAAAMAVVDIGPAVKIATADAPDYLEGPGEIEVKTRNFMMIVR